VDRHEARRELCSCLSSIRGSCVLDTECPVLLFPAADRFCPETTGFERANFSWRQRQLQRGAAGKQASGQPRRIKEAGRD